MKRYEIAICTIIVALLAVLCVYIGGQKYNVDKTKAASGKVNELNDGWEVTYEDGRSEEVTFPILLLQSEGDILLEHEIDSDYSGKAFSVLAENAYVNVFVNDEQIYYSGTANGLINDYSDGDRTNEKNVDIGKLIIDLPDDVKNGDTLIIKLKGDGKTERMSVYEAGISGRDVAVIDIVKKSTLPVLCAIAIIVSSAILMGLDAIRIVGKKRARGLIIIALFAFDTVFYSFTQTNIFYLFFGNRSFFQDIAEISNLLMPVFISGFFFRGFKIHFPTAVRVLFYISSAVAIVNLLTYRYWGEYANAFTWANLVWKLFVLASYMIMLVKWQRLRPQSRQIGMDEAALACLMISVSANFAMMHNSQIRLFNAIQILSSTAYFLFMDVQHIQIMLAENRFQAEKRARELEEKNKTLEIARNEAEEAKQDAILANEAKSRFLANMSHEIRTPINAVLGMDEMILKETREKGTREYAVDIKSAGRTLLSLINDILDFSKIESGKMEIVSVEYEFSQLVTDLVNMISTRAADKGLDFCLDIDENIPSKLVGDDVRLRQCITNLLTNAVKYTHEGSMWLRIGLVELSEDECVLHVEVEDSGIGIKEEDIPKLFKEYERIEESRNRNIEGTGLGINITLQMLGLMGSRLEVSSVYGEGSRFFFDVRQGVADATAVGDISARHYEENGGGAAGEAFIAPDAHVLVVDDNEMNRKVFMSLLKSTRMNIDDADCGPAAIEFAKANHYDIIFMDHMMPDMDGIEAMQTIKALENSPNEDTPIYVLTANAVTGAKEEYMSKGFDGYLSKPVISEKLEEVLRNELPKELIQKAPEGEGLGSVNVDASGPPEDLPVVDGLDWTFAWLHLPGEEMLVDSVRQFYDLIDVQADKLDMMFEELPGSGPMEAYRIQVHGMKGLAATVGIVPLAGMAKILEFAARDENEDIIRNTHKVFIDEWRSYKQKLIGVFDIEDPEEAKKKLEPADYEVTMAALDLLCEAMDEFDIDTSDGLVSTLKSFKYPKDIDEIITQLSGAVADLDNDLVSELVDKIKSKGEWKL